jgi:hypothetical protein
VKLIGSLRGRIWLGAILWTLGLLYLSAPDRANALTK